MAILPARSALCARATITRTTAISSRSFTTTPSRCENNVPPQSPSYIRLPQPPQSEEVWKPRVRGRLPVPRDIFPRQEGDRKVQPDYIQKTAPAPKEQDADADAAPNPVREWKKRMASSRRENLEDSLQSLWTRKQEGNRVRARRSSANFNANKRAMAAPEREDDRLTRSTVLDALMDTSVKPDPARFQRAAASRQRVLAKQTKQTSERRDALMDLYMKASSFIVQESELKSEIERVFAEDFFRKQATAKHIVGAADNVWDVDGVPTTINEMTSLVLDRSDKPLEASKTESERTATRTMKIAEEFTGGKMPSAGTKSQ